MRQIKYKLPRPPKQSGNLAYRVLAFGLAVLLGFLWWQSGKRSSPKPNPKPVVALRPEETNRVHRAALPLPSAKTNLPAFVSPSPQTNATEPAPPPSNSAWPRPVQNVFEAQIALVRQGISPGSLDGAMGSQTRAALAAFQQKEHLPATGELDAATKSGLTLSTEPYTYYTVTSNDLARLQPMAPTWLGKSQQSGLDYETILELVGEKSQSHPNFIRLLNPAIDWDHVRAGTVLRMPDAACPEVHEQAALVKIHLSGKTLEAFDADNHLLAHFPCSIARRVEKRPVGELHVVVIAPHPNYTFDPDVFPESAEARQVNRKLILPPGPNNPVGVAWIGLDRPGYGIHGTPRPEEVGRTESHGCFRLANWNAEFLLRLVAVGTSVYVVE